MGGQICQRIFARLDIPFTPLSNHCEAGIQRGKGQFKTHLVITFTGAAVGYGISAFSPGNFYLLLGDQRAGNRSPEQIFALVNRTGFKQLEHIRCKFFTQVVHDDFTCAAFNGPLFQVGELLALPDVGAVTDHLAVVVLPKPGDDN